jgi:energy-converting hydrogenase Eha subunit A
MLRCFDDSMLSTRPRAVSLSSPIFQQVKSMARHLSFTSSNAYPTFVLAKNVTSINIRILTSVLVSQKRPRKTGP